jgi:hypothetical protein
LTYYKFAIFNLSRQSWNFFWPVGLKVYKNLVSYVLKHSGDCLWIYSVFVKFCRWFSKNFSSTIQSIWIAVLLASASASTSVSRLQIKVLVQWNIFHYNFVILPHHKMWGGGGGYNGFALSRRSVSRSACPSPFLCPLYKSYTNWRIFFKLCSKVSTSTRECAETMLPMCQLKVKVTIEGQISNNKIVDSMIVVSAL